MPRAPATTPRKRPRQARSQATCGVILDATARVLVTTGYDRASTNRIAEVAGVSVGSLYQYFPSKEALVAALIERHSDEIMGLMGERLSGALSGGIEGVVRGAVLAIFEAHRVDPALHRVLYEQVPRVGRLGRLLDDARRIEGVVRGVLEARRCELRAIDLDVAAFLLVSTVEAAVHGSLLVERPTVQPEALVDGLVDMLLRYLREEPGGGLPSARGVG